MQVNPILCTKMAFQCLIVPMYFHKICSDHTQDNHQDPEANIHFSSTVSVTIRVIDEDDQNPRFRETLYEATVGERAPVVSAMLRHI